MELYKQKRKLITITCDYCGKEFANNATPLCSTNLLTNNIINNAN